MTTVQASARVYGIVDGCFIISIDTSLQESMGIAYRGIMYGVMFPPSHRGPRCLEVPLSDLCFPSPTYLLITTLTIQNIMISVADNVVPNYSRYARSLPDSARWLAAEDEGMDSVIQKQSDWVYIILCSSWWCGYVDYVCVRAEVESLQSDRDAQSALSG